jgi:hypothetical protein
MDVARQQPAVKVKRWVGRVGRSGNADGIHRCSD